MQAGVGLWRWVWGQSIQRGRRSLGPSTEEPRWDRPTGVLRVEVCDVKRHNLLVLESSWEITRSCHTFEDLIGWETEKGNPKKQRVRTEHANDFFGFICLIETRRYRSLKVEAKQSVIKVLFLYNFYIFSQSTTYGVSLFRLHFWPWTVLATPCLIHCRRLRPIFWVSASQMSLQQNPLVNALKQIFSPPLVLMTRVGLEGVHFRQVSRRCWSCWCGHSEWTLIPGRPTRTLIYFYLKLPCLWCNFNER